jgi:hypothetical protein
MRGVLFQSAFMRLPIHNTVPSSESLIRTVFWTLWVLTVALTAYALAASSYGVGLFLDIRTPKLHMRYEVRVAEFLSFLCASGLLVVCLSLPQASRALRYLGWAALGFWLFNLSITRI